MSDTPPSFAERRAALVEELRAREVPLPPHIERALLTVPRHLFVPGVYLEAVYRDQVIVTKRDKEGLPVSSSSQPAIMAIMLDALQLEAGQRVLEIGAGTGYNAALLAEIVGAARGLVTTVEIDAEIAESAAAHLARAGYPWVQVVCDDGAAGYAPHAPYDRIISTASVWDLPVAWAQQLRPGGILVTPLDFAGTQIGASLRLHSDGEFAALRLFGLGFIPLKGAAAGPPRSVRLSGSALTLYGDEDNPIDPAQAHTLLSESADLLRLPLVNMELNYNFGYYLLLHLPPNYQIVSYSVQDGQMAYGLENSGWGVFSPTSACMVSPGEQWLARTYGSADAALVLIEAAEAWSGADRPGPERMHLRVTPAGQDAPPPPPYASGARVFTRPAYTYTLWME